MSRNIWGMWAALSFARVRGDAMTWTRIEQAYRRMYGKGLWDLNA